MSTGYNFIDMLMGRPRPQQPNSSDGSFGVQDPMKLFSPLRKAGIAADALVLSGYGTGKQLREQGLQEAQFELAQNQRQDTITALKQRAAAGDKTAEQVLMAVQNRSLSPSDAMKIYFREKFNRTGTTTPAKIQMYEYAKNVLGKSEEEAEIFANTAPTTNINLGAKEGEMLMKDGAEATKRIMGDYQNSRKAANNIALQRQLIQNQDFRSGFGADFIMNTKKLFSQLGFGDAGVSSNEQFQAITNQQVLDRLGGSLGVGVSQGDVDFMLDMVSNLSMTKEGITTYLMIQEIMAEQLNREYTFMVDYIKKQDADLGRQTGFIQNPYIFNISLQEHLASLPPLFE